MSDSRIDPLEALWRYIDPATPLCVPMNVDFNSAILNECTEVIERDKGFDARFYWDSEDANAITQEEKQPSKHLPREHALSVSVLDSQVSFTSLSSKKSEKSSADCFSNSRICSSFRILPNLGNICPINSVFQLLAPSGILPIEAKFRNFFSNCKLGK